jgi:hypothetical protein
VHPVHAPQQVQVRVRANPPRNADRVPAETGRFASHAKSRARTAGRVRAIRPVMTRFDRTWEPMLVVAAVAAFWIASLF